MGGAEIHGLAPRVTDAAVSFNDTTGQLMVLFVMAVAAAEAAIGLALVIALFRNTHSVMTDSMEKLKDT